MPSKTWGNQKHGSDWREKRYLACTTCDMLEILFIIKYHSVLPAVIASIEANPKIQFYKYQFDPVFEEHFLVFCQITGWCSFEKDSLFIQLI
jgi:hypothetical protein